MSMTKAEEDLRRTMVLVLEEVRELKAELKKSSEANKKMAAELKAIHDLVKDTQTVMVKEHHLHTHRLGELYNKP
jgi:3-phosphoglycerate kinase